MTSDDKTTSGRWDEDQMRTDDRPADPRPPASGSDMDREARTEDVVVAGAVVADSETGVVAEEVIAAADVDAGARTDADEGRSVPGWNKGQMAIEDAGEPQPRYDPDTMLESEEGPTGERANPGGGERFGDFDDTRPKDRRPNK